MNRKEVESNSILIGLVGSHAYGLNNEYSDKDYKGVFIAPIDYQLGAFKRIEQKDKGWNEPGLIKELDGIEDITIYELKKFLYLLSKNNPTCIELLYLNDYLLLTSYGQLLVDNRDIFLSKRLKHTYSGYAYSQIKKVENHRAWLLNPPTSPPTLEEFGLFNNRFMSKGSINSFIEFLYFLIKDKVEYLEVSPSLSVFIEEINNIDFKYILKTYPIPDDVYSYVKEITHTSDDFIDLLQRSHSFKKAKDEWCNYQSWLKNRNPKRAEIERKVGYDTKHLSQCLRLLYQGIELLTTQTLTINLKDTPYYQFIKDVKEGNVPYSDVKDKADILFKQMDELYHKSTLKHSPDFDEIDNLSVTILKHFLDLI